MECIERPQSQANGEDRGPTCEHIVDFQDGDLSPILLERTMYGHWIGQPGKHDGTGDLHKPNTTASNHGGCATTQLATRSLPASAT